MGTLQVGGTTLGVKNTSTNKVDLSNVGDVTLTSSANIKGAINASGDAPIYACRAWVNLRGTAQSGTATASGLVSGQYTATVTSATQFTVVYSSTTYTINTSDAHDIAGGVVGQSEGVTLTVSGTSVTIDTQIRGSGNVSSITDYWTGAYIVNLTTAMSDTNYAIQVSVAGTGSYTDWSGSHWYVQTSVTTSAFRVENVNQNDSGSDTSVSVAVFR